MRPKDFFAETLYRLKSTPGFFKRFKFWILLVLFILLLIGLAPYASFLLSIVSGIGSVLRPVVDNKVGRFILVNLILIVVLLVFYRRFKARGRRLLGSWALDRFLAGMLDLSAGRYRRAARRFEAVLRLGRIVDLKEAVAVYPEIASDARIKLSLCYRELSEVEKAMKSLELLKVRDLSPALKRDLAEAKAFVYSMSGKLMEETIDREIAGALETNPGNQRLLRLRRDRAERRGDLPVALEAQKKLVKASRAAARSAERGRLATLHARNALRLHQAGEPEEALAEVSRSRASDPTLVLPNLVAGDISTQQGDMRGAVKEWARTPSLPALERIRGLLTQGELSKEGDLAFLVERFPRSGVLVVLASHYLAEGKVRNAKNCIRKFEELGFANRHSAHLMAEVLRVEGDEAGAERLEWRALKGFLGTDARPPAGPPETV
ncbi:MAG: tetratricopeptide repeat protein [Planctomycetota bacterium]|jgi:tetratricopeptide (TPR) repeat protein